jgi:hypothetical protein
MTLEPWLRQNTPILHTVFLCRRIQVPGGIVSPEREIHRGMGILPVR